MDTGGWIIVGGVAAILAAIMIVGHCVNRRAARLRRGRLQSRPVQPLSDWYEHDYKPAGVGFCTALSVVERLARCLGCHVTQIRATDRFTKELAFGGISFLALAEDDEMDDFANELSGLLGPSAHRLPLDPAETVGELARICDEWLHRDAGGDGPGEVSVAERGDA